MEETIHIFSFKQKGESETPFTWWFEESVYLAGTVGKRSYNVGGFQIHSITSLTSIWGRKIRCLLMEGTIIQGYS